MGKEEGAVEVTVEAAMEAVVVAAKAAAAKAEAAVAEMAVEEMAAWAAAVMAAAVVMAVAAVAKAVETGGGSHVKAGGSQALPLSRKACVQRYESFSSCQETRTRSSPRRRQH